MKFLPSLRHREPRPQAQPPPSPGLNADYYNTDIPFDLPFTSSPPSGPPHRGHSSHRNPRQRSPIFNGFEEDNAPRIVRGHRKPPTRYAKETSSPIYFAPDPPLPGSYLPRSPSRHDHDHNQDRPSERDRRAPRSRRHREHRSPEHEYGYEYGQGRPTAYEPEEPHDRRRNPSRREPPPPEHEHGRSRHERSPQPRSRPQHLHPDDARRSRHRPPSPPPSPAHHSPREHRESNTRRRHHSPSTSPRRRHHSPFTSRRRHHSPSASRSHGHERHARRQHTKPSASPPAAALHRAMASEWWKNPAVQAGARTALNAGAHALMRHRKEEGPWLGPKGAKIAGAALGAALADGLGGEGRK